MKLLTPACPAAVAAILAAVTIFGYQAPVYRVEAKPVKANTAQTKPFVLPETKEISEDKKTEPKGIDTAAPLSAADESDARYADGTYTGSAAGFGGMISVAVTIKDGRITNIRILGASGETPSYFAKAKKLLSRIISSQSTNVDAVSGASYSSNGLILAVRNALKQASNNPAAAEPATPVKKPARQTPKPNKKVKQKPPGQDVSANGLTDGIYTALGEGWGGTMKLQVTVKNGKMTDIKVLSHNDTEEYFQTASALFQIILAKQSTNVDVISGATYSSNGILEAVGKCILQAAKQAAEPKPPASDEQTADNPDPSAEDPAAGTGDTPADGTNIEKTVSVTVSPDEDEDFEPYDVTFTFLLNEGEDTILDILSWEADTNRTNRNYNTQAVTGFQTGIQANGGVTNSRQVDVISGATCSSWGIIDAIAEVLGS